MNTTQNTRRVIAAALLAASAGVALSSCAGQPQVPDPNQVSDAQVAQERAEYRDLAERRSGESHDLAAGGAGHSLDQAERRDGLGGAVGGNPYQDQAERRAGLGGPTAAGDAYRDVGERRLRLTGN